MSIQVVRSGVLDTLQDAGRRGYAKWGINPGGVMDIYAFRLANALVGNNENAAAIEIHFPAADFRLEKDLLIALTGADFAPTVNNVAVATWKPIAVKKNSVLSFRQKRKGNRCYLAIHGGFDTKPWLGSSSTSLRTATGGINGGPLVKGDMIMTMASSEIKQGLLLDGHDFYEFPWSINASAPYSEMTHVGFLEGNEWNWLSSVSKRRLVEEEFTIDAMSDRMAYYLQHPPFEYQHHEELLSSAVAFGTIQALPSGKLVVLMADHQTTGGYPRIGHVISAHLPKLSQLGAHDRLSLRKIAQEESEKMLFSLMLEIDTISQRCREKLNRFYAER